jgi:predicted kinase
MQGLPASGKTTFARKLVEEGFVRVNKDDLRAMMDNSVHTDEHEKRVIRIRDQVVIDALANGKSVVVDDTNLAEKHIKSLQGRAQSLDADFHVIFMDTPLHLCLERNKNRDKQVPEWVIEMMYKKYILPMKQEKTEEEVVEKEECIIVDVDGTLSHIADGRDPYDASRAMNDSLDDAVSVVTGMAYKHGYKVIVLTGRHSGHRKITEEWLEKHGVEYDELYTRLESDNRKDTIIKEELYNTHVKNRFNVKFVIDDRPSVCRMWRGLGLKVLQVGDPHVEF